MDDRDYNRKRNKGWGGEELEMQHQRDAFAKEKHNKVTAVNLEQFQNNEVGKGYQAKHVIRQQSAANTSKIIDMSGGAEFKSASVPETIIKPKVGEEKGYIQSKELRDFRREIETILSSP